MIYYPKQYSKKEILEDLGLKSGSIVTVGRLEPALLAGVSFEVGTIFMILSAKPMGWTTDYYDIHAMLSSGQIIEFTVGLNHWANIITVVCN